MESNIQPKTIKELVTADVYKIPLYQREFAWNEKHISQLFYDILGHVGKDKIYYLGILVVYERENYGSQIFEVVDGQQRLTALHLLLIALKHNKEDSLSWYDEVNLQFQHRPESESTLKKIQDGVDEWEEKDNSAIINAYQVFRRLIKKVEDGTIEDLQSSDVTLDNFTKCLLEGVEIVRAPLPAGTDLNHYFEVMNNRGEQLEKHEVLKAKMMDVFDDEKYRTTFHTIWEACSSMDRYVQYGFGKNIRESLFGRKWDVFYGDCFDDINRKLWEVNERGARESNGKTLRDILNDPSLEEKGSDSQASDSDYHSVIDFPNFLLHVLRIYTGKDISLDDNHLLDQFFKYMNGVSFAKEFAFRLLKMRFLFDKYVIKRNTREEEWSLRGLEYYPNSKSRGYNYTFGDSILNEKVLMLLAMFHVSTPTMAYKHWLAGALNYLYSSWSNCKGNFAENYISYLESQAKAFVFDRHLAKNQKEYYAIFKGKGEFSGDLDDIDEKLLRYENIRHILVFNYLDYLIWKDDKDQDKRIKKFNFTFRSSVEHYYPQSPLGNSAKLNDCYLHDFGNLCLIGNSKNTRLGNLSPKGKNDYYTKNALDSLKQYKMMEYPGEWNTEAIKNHRDAMVEKFKKQIS